MSHRIGVIGGSGLYQMPGLVDTREVTVETPFGPPSDALVTGRLRVADGPDAELVFLPRHGRHHTLVPHEVPFRANIWALKSLGVDWLISVNAVGSLQEPLAPGHVVVVDQLIDRTWRRESSFFGGGAVAHVAFGDPMCHTLRQHLLAATRAEGAVVHDGGTYVVMEGPAFSTRAESQLHRAWGADLIGMTALPEAKLAREAEMSYASLSMVTDYDAWRADEASVTVEDVLTVLRANADLATRVIRRVAPALAAHMGPVPHADALRAALLTPTDAIPARVKAELAPIIGRYLT